MSERTTRPKGSPRRDTEVAFEGGGEWFPPWDLGETPALVEPSAAERRETRTVVTEAPA